MHRFENQRWRLVFFCGGANAGAQKCVSLTHARSPILRHQKPPCDVAHDNQSETCSAPPFMSPRLLRYVVTANMKSGLFCQKCVNKHGNTSSEGHNSILHDKCSEKRRRRRSLCHLPQDKRTNKICLSHRL